MAVYYFRHMRSLVGDCNGVNIDLCIISYQHETQKDVGSIFTKTAASGYVDGEEYERGVRGWREYEEYGLQTYGYTDENSERIRGYVEIDVFDFQRK